MLRDTQIEIEKRVVENFKNGKLRNTLIIVLFEGNGFPKYCVSMSRAPAPQGDIPLTHNFMEVFFSATKKNPAVKDGAVMIKTDGKSPILKGFSFRLYPPPRNIRRKKNMGSGYNSALDFSGVGGVRCVYFVNGKGARKFIDCREVRIC